MRILLGMSEMGPQYFHYRGVHQDSVVYGTEADLRQPVPARDPSPRRGAVHDVISHQKVGL